jgi:ADP-heptose:LPS heptosyltransferase
VEWASTHDHTAVQQARLAALALPSVDPRHATRYVLAPVPTDVARHADVMLSELGLVEGTFAVVHMGVGSALREWPREKWRALTRALSDRGLRVALTGAGADQVRDAEEVARGGEYVNLAGRLRWHEFVHVIAKARVVIAPETVAGHVAAAVGTPFVALYTGMGETDHWRPLSSRGEMLMNAVPCAPCHRRRGCATMDCIRGIGVDDVVSAAMRVSEDRAMRIGRDAPSLQRDMA